MQQDSQQYSQQYGQQYSQQCSELGAAHLQDAAVQMQDKVAVNALWPAWLQLSQP
jgi:hypothetical protein